MNYLEMIEWMERFAERNKAFLDLEGEDGYIGIQVDNRFPAYDDNGKVWTPPDAFHKNTILAVRGTGPLAEEQLFQWLKWFDDNGFIVESGYDDDGDSYVSMVQRAIYNL